jgi:hypothetical protein
MGIEGNTLKRDIYTITSPTLFAPYDQKAPESYKITIYDEQDAPIAEGRYRDRFPKEPVKRQRTRKN